MADKSSIGKAILIIGIMAAIGIGITAYTLNTMKNLPPEGSFSYEGTLSEVSGTTRTTQYTIGTTVYTQEIIDYNFLITLGNGKVLPASFTISAEQITDPDLYSEVKTPLANGMLVRISGVKDVGTGDLTVTGLHVVHS